MRGVLPSAVSCDPVLSLAHLTKVWQAQGDWPVGRACNTPTVQPLLVHVQSHRGRLQVPGELCFVTSYMSGLRQT